MSSRQALHHLQVVCAVASSSKRWASLMWLDSSRHSLPPTTASVALRPTVWYQWTFSSSSSSSFLYSPWFPCVALYNFKLVIRFVFSSYLIPLLLITIFLFQIIYKITIVFRFHPLSIFSSLRFSSHSFYWYLFYF